MNATIAAGDPYTIISRCIYCRKPIGTTGIWNVALVTFTHANGERECAS